MKRNALVIVIIMGTLLALVTVWVEARQDQVYALPAVESGSPLLSAQMMPISRNKSYTINTENLFVYGPHICTAYGDPYSPFNSVFRPPGYPSGSYTYRYAIRIPAAFPHDTVRVELFDPDSYNSANNTDTIIRTNFAISPTAGTPLPPTTTETCMGTAGNRVNTCLLETGEAAFVTGPPYVSVDYINPLWFMRVDKNRGNGPAPGDGTCGQPPAYDPAYNTQTLYELYYLARNPDNSVQQVSLATYTGRVDNAHDTDLRWVSPGSPLSYDQPVPVPIDPGSPQADFEINLATETPNILTDPETGDRYLYLGVTGIYGSSGNGFHIWAGPNTYPSTVPSNVNARQLEVLNNTGSHRSDGVEVFALDALPLRANYAGVVDRPFLELTAYADAPTSFTLFDSDVGTQSPITITFSTLAAENWSRVFGLPGTTDPDGVPADSRCFPTCNNQFITPTYTITTPGVLENCDWQNPDPADCTPFYGGDLTMRHQAGADDDYVIISTSPRPPLYDISVGCSAFPILIQEGVRSLNPPGMPPNPFPEPGDYHPSSPIATYAQFPQNVPDVPLTDAQEGYIYKISNGAGPGNFGWSTWNMGINTSSSTLANSLTWPGDAFDYTNHGDGGLPAAAQYPWVVRGYVNPVDNTDLSMQVGDWLATNNGSTISPAIRTTINGHITRGRTLRLPIWGDETQGTGNSTIYRLTGFALFRLQGYNLTQSGGPSWLLMEFIGWDNSCGRNDLPPNDVTITGPVTGTLPTTAAFTATVSFPGTARPITYTWQAPGQNTITHTGGISHSVTYTWPANFSSGTETYTITVMAQNRYGVVTDTHAISFSPPLTIPLTGAAITGPLTATVSGWYSFTAAASPMEATQPITYLWQATGQSPFTQTGGLNSTAVFRWPTPHTYTLIVTATNGLSTVTDTHQVVIVPASPIPGCAAFPIAFHEGARSATPPGTGANPFPSPGDFQVGSPVPTYDQFIHHVPDIPLSSAQPGTVYWLSRGTGAGNFGWLRWNEGINAVDAMLVTSLTAPGNSLDYRNHGDGGQPVAVAYPWVVRGYVNPLDVTDLILHPGDWVAEYPGSASSTAVRNTLTDHANAGRELRLLVWDQAQGGANALYRLVQLAVFRVQGYNLTAPARLLVEFVRWDATVCTVGDFPISTAVINGPTTGVVATTYSFLGAVGPVEASLPVTHTWQTAGQPPIIHTNGLSDTVALSWDQPGVQVITLTADNGYMPLTTTHTITIHQTDLAVGQLELVTPPPIVAGEPVDFRVVISNTSDADINTQFFVDVFINPTVILTTGIPITESAGYGGVNALAAHSTFVLTITAPFGFTDVSTTTHEVYAMVDSVYQIEESDETNNVTGPLWVTDVLPPPVPLADVTIAGLTAGLVDVPYDFTAVVSPLTVTQPITYIWQTAVGTMTQTNGITATATFTWSTPGLQVITVTATNGINTVTDTHTINLTLTPVPIVGVTVMGPVTGTAGLSYDFTAVVSPLTATQPITYIWQATAQDTVLETGGASSGVTFSWGVTGTKTITVTADNGVSQAVAVTTIDIEAAIVNGGWYIYLPFIVVNEP